MGVGEWVLNCKPFAGGGLEQLAVAAYKGQSD